jgi:hypothetical protein
MQSINLGSHIRAPIENVWELLSDQEGYTFARQVKEARLLQEGDGDKNGVGARLKIRAMGASIIWEVVAFDPPNRFEYRITDFPIPFRHESGIMELSSSDDGTDASWVSRFEAPIPLIGRILEKIIGGVFGKIHQSVLDQAKAKLEA